MTYDGRDLDDVCRLTGLSAREVVERHTAPAYPVAFVGFSPGFPYLLGLDPALAVPRLDRPGPGPCRLGRHRWRPDRRLPDRDSRRLAADRPDGCCPVRPPARAGGAAAGRRLGAVRRPMTSLTVVTAGPVRRSGTSAVPAGPAQACRSPERWTQALAAANRAVGNPDSAAGLRVCPARAEPARGRRGVRLRGRRWLDPRTSAARGGGPAPSGCRRACAAGWPCPAASPASRSWAVGPATR